jgi:uncharacterized membrane protein (DUF106 family)
MRFGFSQANTVFILIGFNVFVILLVNFLPHLDLTYFVLGISAFAILVSLFFRLTEKEELV